MSNLTRYAAVLLLNCAWLLIAARYAGAAEVSGELTVDGRPVSEAVVRLRATGEKLLAVTFTDASGKYLFKDVSAGRYSLEIDKDGRNLHQAFVEVDGSNIKARLDMGAIERPLGVELRKSGDLMVLDAGTRHYKRLLLLNVSSSGLAFQASIEFLHELVNMAAAEFNGQEFIFVVAPLAGVPILQQIASPTGRRVRSWKLYQGCTRLEVDDTKHIVYFVSPSNELFRLDMATGSIRFIHGIPEAERLGPMAIDASQQRLYIADQQNGDLYVVELDALSTRGIHHRKVSRGLGTPIALALNESNKRIYVLDGESHKIRSLNLGDSRMLVESAIFSQRSEFRNPVNISLKDGNLWVADSDAHALFQLAADGTVAKRYSYFVRTFSLH